MPSFENQTKDMNSAEVLNLYRNMYYAEPDTTERGIVARAINDILPKYVAAQEDSKSAGEWILKNDGAYGKTRTYCSVCGKRSGIGGIRSNQLKPYCPNCGAKMNYKEKM